MKIGGGSDSEDKKTPPKKNRKDKGEHTQTKQLQFRVREQRGGREKDGEKPGS